MQYHHTSGQPLISVNHETHKEEVVDEFIGKYCMVRTYSAGVFAGILKKLDGKEAVLTNARRIWFWLWLWLW